MTLPEDAVDLAALLHDNDFSWDDANAVNVILSHHEFAVRAAREEWRDHIPSGFEDQSGYGQVSCSCGWDSGDKLGWEEHIDAAERIGRA